MQTYGPEYRVLQLDAIDDIYDSWEPNTNIWNPNVEYVHTNFGDCTVYEDLEEAWDAANALESVKETDQGICLLSDFKSLKFLSLGNENGKEAASKE